MHLNQSLFIKKSTKQKPFIITTVSSNKKQQRQSKQMSISTSLTQQWILKVKSKQKVIQQISNFSCQIVQMKQFLNKQVKQKFLQMYILYKQGNKKSIQLIMMIVRQLQNENQKLNIENKTLKKQILQFQMKRNQEKTKMKKFFNQETERIKQQIKRVIEDQNHFDQKNKNVDNSQQNVMSGTGQQYLDQQIQECLDNFSKQLNPDEFTVACEKSLQPGLYGTPINSSSIFLSQSASLETIRQVTEIDEAQIQYISRKLSSLLLEDKQQQKNQQNQYVKTIFMNQGNQSHHKKCQQDEKQLIKEKTEEQVESSIVKKLLRKQQNIKSKTTGQKQIQKFQQSLSKCQDTEILEKSKFNMSQIMNTNKFHEFSSNSNRSIRSFSSLLAQDNIVLNINQSEKVHMKSLPSQFNHRDLWSAQSSQSLEESQNISIKQANILDALNVLKSYNGLTDCYKNNKKIQAKTRNQRISTVQESKQLLDFYKNNNKENIKEEKTMVINLQTKKDCPQSIICLNSKKKPSSFQNRSVQFALNSRSQNQNYIKFNNSQNLLYNPSLQVKQTPSKILGMSKNPNPNYNNKY